MKTVSLYLIPLVVMSLFFINFCDLVYRCGCRSLWDGADTHCNRHAPAGHKHCPFCSHGYAGYAVFFGGIALSQLAAIRALTGRGIIVQLIAGLVTFPIAGGLIALAVGLLDGYWLP
ncbi:hypothetical protein F183_A35720 [Bryobacterales bacterium F-183]|nr:hypothetical protein F183_A35720 [Bryobacterales bacterium F-183]